MPEELPNLGVEPLAEPHHPVHASERNRTPFALTPERAEELYPHLFKSPKFAAVFREKVVPKATPEQIGQGILRLDAAWRRRRRKQIEGGIEPGTPPEERRLLVSQIITQETTPGRPKENAILGTLREARTGGANVAESAVNTLARGMLSLAGDEPPEAPLAELPTLQGLVRAAGAEVPLLPAYALPGAAFAVAPAVAAGTRGAVPIARALTALLRTAQSGSLPARAAATAGLGVISESAATPLAIMTTPEGMDETALQRLLMAGLLGGAAPVAAAGARGLAGAAQRGLARAVPVPQLDVSGSAAGARQEIAEALRRLRAQRPPRPAEVTVQARGGPPTEVTNVQRGPGFETTTPGRAMSDVTVRESMPAMGADREAMFQPQRPIRETTINDRVPLGPSERSLSEAVHAQGLEATAPGAPAFPETATVRARMFAEPATVRTAGSVVNAPEPTVRARLPAVRPETVQPFDGRRLVLPTDAPDVAAAVRQAAEQRYKTRYDAFLAGRVSPREAAHRASQAAEKVANEVRASALRIRQTRARMSDLAADVVDATPRLKTSAIAARVAAGAKVEAIVGRTMTPEIRAGAATAASELRQAAQPKRTLGQLRRSLDKDIARVAALMEGADVPKAKARTPRPPGPMGRVRNLEKRLEQDRKDRFLQEYNSPAETATPRTTPGPPPAVPPPPRGPPPPPSPSTAEVLAKVGRFFDLNNPTGMRGILGRMRDWAVGPGHRGAPEVAAAFNQLRGATNAGRLNSTLAMRKLNKLVGGRPRTNAELWTPDSPALAKELQATRRYMDDLSRQIIEELRLAGRPPDDPLIQSIEAHVGTYVRRQYAQPWRPPDRLLKPAIRLLLDDNVRILERGEELAAKAAARGEPELAARHLERAERRLLNGDEIAAALYAMAQGKEVEIVGQKLGRLNLSLIKKRTDIPVELRRVMGEIEGLPAVGITIADQERFLATLKFHRKLYGLGYFGTAPDSARGWTRQLPGNPGRDEWANEWTAEGVQSLGVLAGKWTTPEVYSGLAETAARQNEILQWVGAATGLWRAGKLIAMPTIMHNFYGNAGHAAAAGTLSYNPAAQIRDLGLAGAELLRYAKRGIGEVGGAVDNAIRDGVLDAEMATSEFRPALDMFVKAAQRRIEGGGSEALTALANGVERMGQFGFKVFDLADQLWKLDGYMKTVRRVRTQLPRATDAEVRERAARHVLNYFPDYGGVGKGVKAARGLGGILFNNFVTYQAEWTRILGGIGYRSAFGTPAERADAAIAAIRLAGYTGLLFGIGAIMGRMHGLNAAEVAALQGAPGGRIGAKTAALAKESTRQIVKASKPISFIWPYRDALGRPQMVDMTYFHPLGDWFKHYPGESFGGWVLNAVADHFLAPHIAEMFVSPIAEEMGAEPGFERPNTIQSLYATLEPRTLLSVRRVVEKMLGPSARLGFMPPAFPKTDEPTAGQMVMNEVLGIPVTPIGPVEQQGADLEQAAIPKEMIRAIIRAQNEPPHRLSPDQRRQAEKEAEERAARKEKRYR